MCRIIRCTQKRARGAGRKVCRILTALDFPWARADSRMMTGKPAQRVAPTPVRVTPRSDDPYGRALPRGGDADGARARSAPPVLPEPVGRHLLSVLPAVHSPARVGDPFDAQRGGVGHRPVRQLPAALTGALLRIRAGHGQRHGPTVGAARAALGARARCQARPWASRRRRPRLLRADWSTSCPKSRQSAARTASGPWARAAPGRPSQVSVAADRPVSAAASSLASVSCWRRPSGEARCAARAGRRRSAGGGCSRAPRPVRRRTWPPSRPGP